MPIMALWCIIHSNERGGSRVWLQEQTATVLYARLNAALAGFKLEEGESAETFKIEPAAARKIPKRMVGRVLQGTEVERLMKILAKTAKP